MTCPSVRALVTRSRGCRPRGYGLRRHDGETAGSRTRSPLVVESNQPKPMPRELFVLASNFILAINFIGLDRIWRFDLNQY
jgi:hypothetical protein